MNTKPTEERRARRYVRPEYRVPGGFYYWARVRMWYAESDGDLDDVPVMFWDGCPIEPADDKDRAICAYLRTSEAFKLVTSSCPCCNYPINLHNDSPCEPEA